MVLVVSGGTLQVAQPPSLAGDPANSIDTAKGPACGACGLHLSVADERNIPRTNQPVSRLSRASLRRGAVSAPVSGREAVENTADSRTTFYGMVMGSATLAAALTVSPSASLGTVVDGTSGIVALAPPSPARTAAGATGTAKGGPHEARFTSPPCTSPLASSGLSVAPHPPSPPRPSPARQSAASCAAVA